jgi:hypothetical protein
MPFLSAPGAPPRYETFAPVCSGSAKVFEFALYALIVNALSRPQ